jgi:hypothetical protein
MELDAAIQQYLIGLKEQAPRERLEFDLVVLARLQEFLEGDPTIDRAQAIRAADLKEYIHHWVRSGEDVTPETAERVVEAIVQFAEWLDRQLASRSEPTSSSSRSGGGPIGSGARDPIAPTLAPLAEALPRAARAAEILIRHIHRGDLGEAIPVEEAPGGSPLGTISSGISRVIRPAEVDYARAEEDTFRVVEVGERSVALLSPAREQLGEGPAAPVAVPVRAARLLRAGDILHVEIAPAGAGWEILNVESVIPGGLDDRP